MKKIVIISPFQFLLQRGIERFVYSLANSLCEKYSIQIVIYVWGGKENNNWSEWHPNINIRHVPLIKYYQRPFSALFYNLWLGVDKPDAVFVNFLYHGEEYLIKRYPCYCILHSPASQVPNRYAYIENIYKKFKNIRFVAVSDMVKREALAYIDSSKILVIKNGVDVNKFRCEALIRPSDETLKIVTFSALEERKGMQFVLKGIAELRNSDIRYDIYGDGPYKFELKQSIRDLSLTQNVFLHSSTKDVKEILCKSDIFCLLSKGEAFPLSPLEAMSCGLPIVTSNHPPYDEFIDEKTGFMISPKSTNQFVSAISKLTSASLRKKMGSAGRKLVEQQYSWSIVSEQYYEMILDESLANKMN
jgi:glycosyltransferase involved in cell wall biosynthesis